MVLCVVNPYHVNFSTSSISNHFTTGVFLDEVFDKTINGEIALDGPTSLPKIEVMIYQGEYWVVRGNRRLYVMRKLYIAGFLDEIMVDVLDRTNVVCERFFSNFTTPCNGRYVRVRNAVVIGDMDVLIKDLTIAWWQTQRRKQEARGVDDYILRRLDTVTNHMSNSSQDTYSDKSYTISEFMQQKEELFAVMAEFYQYLDTHSSSNNIVIDTAVGETESTIDNLKLVQESSPEKSSSSMADLTLEMEELQYLVSSPLDHSSQFRSTSSNSRRSLSLDSSTSALSKRSESGRSESVWSVRSRSSRISERSGYSKRSGSSRSESVRSRSSRLSERSGYSKRSASMRSGSVRSESSKISERSEYSTRSESMRSESLKSESSKISQGSEYSTRSVSSTTSLRSKSSKRSESVRSEFSKTSESVTSVNSIRENLEYLRSESIKLCEAKSRKKLFEYMTPGECLKRLEALKRTANFSSDSDDDCTEDTERLLREREVRQKKKQFRRRELTPEPENLCSSDSDSNVCPGVTKNKPPECAETNSSLSLTMMFRSYWSELDRKRQTSHRTKTSTNVRRKLNFLDDDDKENVDTFPRDDIENDHLGKPRKNTLRMTNTNTLPSYTQETKADIFDELYKIANTNTNNDTNNDTGLNVSASISPDVHCSRQSVKRKCNFSADENTNPSICARSDENSKPRSDENSKASICTSVNGKMSNHSDVLCVSNYGDTYIKRRKIHNVTATPCTAVQETETSINFDAGSPERNKNDVASGIANKTTANKVTDNLDCDIIHINHSDEQLSHSIKDTDINWQCGSRSDGRKSRGMTRKEGKWFTRLLHKGAKNGGNLFVTADGDAKSIKWPKLSVGKIKT